MDDEVLDVADGDAADGDEADGDAADGEADEDEADEDEAVDDDDGLFNLTETALLRASFFFCVVYQLASFQVASFPSLHLMKYLPPIIIDLQLARDYYTPLKFVVKNKDQGTRQELSTH